MFRSYWPGGLSAFTLLALLCPSWAEAQIVAPPFRPAPNPRVPNAQVPDIDRLQQELQRQREDLQKQLDELRRQLGRGLNPDLFQQELNRRALQGDGTTVSWGGLRVKKVTPALQEKLGLPENEGLLVAAVDADSAADKAGLKLNDVLVKVNNQPVPNDFAGFAKMVKDQKSTDAVEFTVVRGGKEEAIKGIKMPAEVQSNPGARAGLPPGFPGILMPRININPGVRVPNQNLFPNPFQQGGGIQNLQMEMTVNGAKISRKQTTDQFSGTYAKAELTITVKGKLDNGLPKIDEISVQEGRETKTYARLGDVPAQHRTIIQRLLLPASANPLIFPLQGLPIIPNFPGFPQFPGLDDD